jgi:superfamily I DNA and/or RNA helicase
MMPSDTLETLRQVNDNLRSALIRLRPERKHCSTIRPQDFSDILSQLLRAAECLRRSQAPSEAAVALEKESLEYRSNLEKLKNFLPDLQARLLAEKSRLETARAHVTAAAAWARASKKTL